MMKTMKMMMTAVMLMIASTACTGQDKVITEKELPASAQKLMKEQFADKQVAIVQKDRDGLRTSYDVVYSDGTKLEFDSKGEWTEIDSKPQTVPSALVPREITDYVVKTYPNVRIVQIERDKRGYETDLSNGLEVRFNKQFKVVEIDN